MKSVHPVVKLLIFWLTVNVSAALFAGLIFVPFQPRGKWVEHVIFLSHLLIGTGSFYFAASELGINPQTPTQMFLEDKRKHLAIASRYFLNYVGFIILAAAIAYRSIISLDAFLRLLAAISILGTGKDLLRFNACHQRLAEERCFLSMCFSPYYWEFLQAIVIF